MKYQVKLQTQAICDTMIDVDATDVGAAYELVQEQIKSGKMSVNLDFKLTQPVRVVSINEKQVEQ